MSNQCNCIESAKRKARNCCRSKKFLFYILTFLIIGTSDLLYGAGPLPETAGRTLSLLEFLKNSNWKNQMFLIKRASDFRFVSSKNSSRTLTMNSDEILFLLKDSDRRNQMALELSKILSTVCSSYKILIREFEGFKNDC